MCLEDKKNKCLCHRIKPFILADKNKKFYAQHFEPSHNTELYFFLQLAYSLVDAPSDEKFDENLKLLVTVYIELPKERGDFDSLSQTINVNDEGNRVAFLAAYKEYEKNQERPQLCSALAILIKDVEKLVYNNRSSDASFIELLEKNPKIYGRKHSSANLKTVRWGLSAQSDHSSKDSADEPIPPGSSHSSTL